MFVKPTVPRVARTFPSGAIFLTEEPLQRSHTNWQPPNYAPNCRNPGSHHCDLCPSPFLWRGRPSRRSIRKGIRGPQRPAASPRCADCRQAQRGSRSAQSRRRHASLASTMHFPARPVLRESAWLDTTRFQLGPAAPERLRLQSARTGL